MRHRFVLSFVAMLSLSACGRAGQEGPSAGQSGPVSPAPSAETAVAQLNASPRHGEYAMIQTGQGDSVRAYVVYPERRDEAPVVLVVHEIYGLSNWIRSVADQLAAEGYIAIAPDLLTGKGVPNDSAGDPVRDRATAEIRTLSPDDVHRRLHSIAQWGTALPAAADRYGIVGFCWGGSTSFTHAVRDPDLDASVVYYGGSPDPATLTSVRAPVLGLYGGADARVNATIPAADSTMKRLGKTYEVRIYEGAGHGFLRQQNAPGSPNHVAAEKGWQETIAWFRRYLG